MNTNVVFKTDEQAGTVFLMKVLQAPVSRVWEYFTQPELLDQWWAPKPWMCKTSALDLKPGGIWAYQMLGPEGEKHNCGAKFNEITTHRSIDYIDFFADENGVLDANLPATKSLIGFTGVAEGTKLTINNHFNSAAEMQQILKMGAEQGIKKALHQLEQLLNKKD